MGMDDEAAVEMVERRWFAALRAAQHAQQECAVLLNAMRCSESAWQQARARLTELETLRDTLGVQLAVLDDGGTNAASDAGRREPGAPTEYTSREDLISAA